MALADQMIGEEVQKMIINDNFKYPFKGMKEIRQPIEVEEYSSNAILKA